MDGGCSSPCISTYSCISSVIQMLTKPLFANSIHTRFWYGVWECKEAVVKDIMYEDKV